MFAPDAKSSAFKIVEANDYDAVEKFLCPGFKRCKATITPVSQFFGK